MIFSKKFIKATNEMCDFDNFVPAPYFRKKFNLDFKPTTAEITICGLGFYELYINGKNITKGPLAPYISNPDDLCYYDNYDVAEYLGEGDNVIGVILGNGFRNCYGGFIWDFEKADCRGPVTFALNFDAKSDKGELCFEADESFKTHQSPILYDDLRMGYCYDSRLEIPNWNMPDFDDSDWSNAMPEKTPRGTAKLCEAEPIVVTDALEAVEIKHFDKAAFAHDKQTEGVPAFESTVKNDVYVYDFGFNTAGVTQLKINGEPGQKIVIRHGEHTVRGEFSINTTLFQRGNEVENERYREYGQVDTFICKGGEETFVPRFKYDGFRYAYIEGLKPHQATKDAVVCLVMNSDLKIRGSFSCSDETINALWKCTRHADLANFYYFPTDCPHREKNGWTADAWLSSEHMLLNLTAENSLREWLFNIQHSQSIEGALPGIVPTDGWGFAWGNGPVWDAICVEIPYYIYKYTGNAAVIKENASMIMRYLIYVSSRRDEDGLTGFGLGDWVDPFRHQKGYISSPIEVTASIATLDISTKAAFLFEQVGLDKEAKYAKTLSEEMRESIRTNLIDFETMTVKGDCQTSQALGLAMGIFNPDEKACAQKRLVEIIHRDGDVNACGVYGIRYIYHMLSEMGESELAYKVITSKSRTCYGHWIENGATALCESFREFDDPEVDSRNHHFLGDIASWFVQSLAGLKPNPNADDIAHFEVSPSFVSSLDYAEANFVSAFGNTAVRWERCENGNIRLVTETPSGVHGEIILPENYRFENGDTTAKLACGKHEMTILK